MNFVQEPLYKRALKKLLAKKEGRQELRMSDNVLKDDKNQDLKDYYIHHPSNYDKERNCRMTMDKVLQKRKMKFKTF